MKWSNWSGLVTCQPNRIEKPANQEALVELVRSCVAKGEVLRPVGAGHSFTPLVQTDQVMVSLNDLAGLLSVDSDGRSARVRAGTNLKQLGEMLFQQGLAQENLGDIDVQSIAGAVSTGTHGTGPRFGVIATQIESLTLVILKDPGADAVLATDDISYMGLAIVDLGAKLVGIDGLTFGVFAANVKVNQMTVGATAAAGSTKVDWTTFTETADSTGYFAAVPKETVPFPEAVAYLRGHVFDDFMHNCQTQTCSLVDLLSRKVWIKDLINYRIVHAGSGIGYF